MLFILLACSTAPQTSPIIAPEPAPQPVPVAQPAPDTDPLFSYDIEPLPADLRGMMENTTYQAGCPVGLDELVLLTASRWGFDGQPATGTVVLRADVVDVVVDVLEAAWDARFPIERMEPASAFGGSDEASMAANNTSAFNCRPITGGSSWSQHSYGNAIDINPRQNPYISGSGKTILPPEGAPYVVRDPGVPGLIVDPSPIVDTFRSHGWGWGGDWSSLKDYQHFSESGK